MTYLKYIALYSVFFSGKIEGLMGNQQVIESNLSFKQKHGNL